jgi:hypothetical protein
MTLREALLAFGNPEQIAEMLRLEATGYRGDYAMFVLGRLETENERKQRRFRELRQIAENLLRAKLVTGEVIATGRDPRQAIDAPRVKVPEDRWPSLAFDFKTSAARGDGLYITQILVSAVGSLYIRRTTRHARLGGIDLDLSPQSYDLLLELAQHALAGPAPVGIRELKKKFFERRDQKALGQAMAILRRQMTKSGVEKATAARLIGNHRRVGYALRMPSQEILIE